MMSKTSLVRLFAGLILTLCWTARGADLYQAAAAVDKKDLESAFGMYLELARLGQPEAQENVAVMYVNGEGVKRDNILGYAWARLAVENGGGETAQGIVRQLEPHIKDAQRVRITEVDAQFGKAALQSRLLPTKIETPIDPSAHPCKMVRAANPDNFYPVKARNERQQGIAMVQAEISADGSARNPRVWYSFPVGVFDQSARAVALQSKYASTAPEGGEPCRMVFKVKYTIAGMSNDKAVAAQELLKPRALKGDPHSQVAYGILLATYSELNKDKEDVLGWFLKAAQSGVPSGQYLVGTYIDGRVLAEKEVPKARAWFDMAAAAGSQGAMISLANYELRNADDPAARARGVALMRRAAEDNNWLAQYYLADLLATDSRTPWHDPSSALKLLEGLNGGFDYDPTFFEIRAAAHAALGNFDEARNSQARAMSGAQRIGWNLDAMRSRMELYRQGKRFDGELIRF